MTPSIQALNVMLVDDHVMVAEAIRGIIEGHVASVAVVISGEALLRALSTSRPDLILLDISMPGLNGLDALEALNLLGLSIPVVMLTMHDEPGIARRALEAGAMGYVLKQASGEDLLAALSMAVQGRVFVSSSVRHRIRDLAERNSRRGPPEFRC